MTDLLYSLALAGAALTILGVVRYCRRRLATFAALYAEATARNVELREMARTAYETGYTDGQAHTHTVRDAEAESIRRNAYQRGRRDAMRAQRAEAA